MKQHYQLALLYLTHLLIFADGIVDENETDALKIIKKKENISDALFNEFQHNIENKKDRDLYQLAIESLNQCSNEEKLRAFVTLYKLSEVDGRVHVKEIRLLLYSIKHVGIEFNDVVNHAIVTPSLI